MEIRHVNDTYVTLSKTEKSASPFRWLYINHEMALLYARIVVYINTFDEHLN